MEMNPGIIERSIARVFSKSLREPQPSALIPQSPKSMKSVRHPYPFAKEIHDRATIPTVDELISQYVELTDMTIPSDSTFIESLHARNALRKHIVAAACREDRLVEISQLLMDVEMTAFTHCPDGSDASSSKMSLPNHGTKAAKI